MKEKQLQPMSSLIASITNCYFVTLHSVTQLSLIVTVIVVIIIIQTKNATDDA